MRYGIYYAIYRLVEGFFGRENIQKYFQENMLTVIIVGLIAFVLLVIGKAHLEPDPPSAKKSFKEKSFKEWVKPELQARPEGGGGNGPGTPGSGTSAGDPR
jgi:hypothetical protein